MVFSSMDLARSDGLEATLELAAPIVGIKGEGGGMTFVHLYTTSKASYRQVHDPSTINWLIRKNHIHRFSLESADLLHSHAQKTRRLRLATKWCSPCDCRAVMLCETGYTFQSKGLHSG